MLECDFLNSSPVYISVRSLYSLTYMYLTDCHNLDIQALGYTSYYLSHFR